MPLVTGRTKPASAARPYGRAATLQEIDANWTTGSAPTARTRILCNIHWPQSTTTTDYFAFAGQTIAIHDTNWHYLVADQLGSPVVQLNASGSPKLVRPSCPTALGATRRRAWAI